MHPWGGRSASLLSLGIFPREEGATCNKSEAREAECWEISRDVAPESPITEGEGKKSGHLTRSEAPGGARTTWLTTALYKTCWLSSIRLRVEGDQLPGSGWVGGSWTLDSHFCSPRFLFPFEIAHPSPTPTKCKETISPFSRWSRSLHWWPQKNLDVIFLREPVSSLSGAQRSVEWHCWMRVQRWLRPITHGVSPPTGYSKFKREAFTSQPSNSLSKDNSGN